MFDILISFIFHIISYRFFSYANDYFGFYLFFYFNRFHKKSKYYGLPKLSCSTDESMIFLVWKCIMISDLYFNHKVVYCATSAKKMEFLVSGKFAVRTETIRRWTDEQYCKLHKSFKYLLSAPIWGPFINHVTLKGGGGSV